MLSLHVVMSCHVRSELPIGKWTGDYKAFLESLIGKTHAHACAGTR